MAKEDLKEKPIEKVKTEEVKTESITAHTIKREVTVDKLYKKGSTIYLPDGKIKDSLISNKFI